MTLRIIVLAAMLALASSQQACTAYCVKGTEPTTRTVAAGEVCPPANGGTVVVPGLPDG